MQFEDMLLILGRDETCHDHACAVLNKAGKRCVGITIENYKVRLISIDSSGIIRSLLKAITD